MTFSLFDLAHQHVVDAYLCFRNNVDEVSPFWKLLKDGYRHVELWRHLGESVWLRVNPCLETTEIEFHMAPPWSVINPVLKPSFVRVQRTAPHGKARDLFFVGPMTCVEIIKSFVGLRNAFVRTPWQLYKALR